MNTATKRVLAGLVSMTREKIMENHKCHTCGKDCPIPFAIDIPNGWYYCSQMCYVKTLFKKPQKCLNDYPDNSRDEFGEDGGC